MHLSEKAAPYFTLFYGMKKNSFGVGEHQATLPSLDT